MENKLEPQVDRYGFIVYSKTFTQRKNSLKQRITNFTRRFLGRPERKPYLAPITQREMKMSLYQRVIAFEAKVGLDMEQLWNKFEAWLESELKANPPGTQPAPAVQATGIVSEDPNASEEETANAAGTTDPNA
jgi:hypothetical protein